MFSWYLSWPKYITLAVLLDHVGLDAAAYTEALQAAGLDLTTGYRRDTLLHNEKIRAFYDSIRPDIQRHAAEQYKNLAAYVRATVAQGERVALVDLGGSGTIEHALRAFLESLHLSCVLLPMYVESVNVRLAPDAACIDAGKRSGKRSAQLRMCYMFLEVFFSAPHGTVLGYKRRDSAIVPQLAPWEYQAEPYARDRAILEDLQAGALQFVRDYAAYDRAGFALSEEIAMQAFCSFGIVPSRADVDFWRGFHWYADAFVTLLPSYTRSAYLTRPDRMRRDMNETLWTGGYWRSLCASPLGSLIFYIMVRLYRQLKAHQ